MATVWTHPPPQAASTVHCTFGDDEEVLAARVRPAPLSEVAGPQERVQRHTVEQIVDFVPVVQILNAPVPQTGASITGVLEQVIVPPLPEVQVVGRVARVRARLVAVPVLADRLDFVTPRALLWSLRKSRRRTTRWRRKKSWRCSTIDWFEHSSWRPRRLCRPYMAGRCEDGWSCTLAHCEHELHPSTLRAAERRRASAADHG